eukprot:scaffold53635_cov75-Phaeocystis_antarctica.AAC.1
MPRLPPRANARRVAAGPIGIGAQQIGRPLDHGRTSLRGEGIPRSLAQDASFPQDASTPCPRRTIFKAWIAASASSEPRRAFRAVNACSAPPPVRRPQARALADAPRQRARQPRSGGNGGGCASPLVLAAAGSSFASKRFLVRTAVEAMRASRSAEAMARSTRVPSCAAAAPVRSCGALAGASSRARRPRVRACSRTTNLTHMAAWRTATSAFAL